MSLKEHALRTAVLKAVSDALKSEVEADRGDLFEELCGLHELTGAKSLDVTLPDGRKVASISLAMPKAGPAITDSAAFDAFIAEQYPQAIIKVPARKEIAESFREELLSRLVAAGNPMGSEMVDASLGMLVPGVEYHEAGGPKSFSVRFEKTGREQIAAAWSDGDFGPLMPGIAPDRPALPGAVD